MTHRLKPTDGDTLTHQDVEGVVSFLRAVQATPQEVAELMAEHNLDPLFIEAAKEYAESMPSPLDFRVQVMEVLNDLKKPTEEV